MLWPVEDLPECTMDGVRKREYQRDDDGIGEGMVKRGRDMCVFESNLYRFDSNGSEQSAYACRPGSRCE